MACSLVSELFQMVISWINRNCLCEWLKKSRLEILQGKLNNFFSRWARLGSPRPWWSANRDKIYQVVHESEKVENSCSLSNPSIIFRSCTVLVGWP